jgi:hypothetical protein
MVNAWHQMGRCADADDTRNCHAARPTSLIITFPPLTMSLRSLPPAKRRKRSTALVEDDDEAAEAVTHEKVKKITRSGVTKIQTLLVPLVPVLEERENAAEVPAQQEDFNYFGSYNENPNLEHNTPPKTSKVKIAIALNIKQIVITVH